MISSTPIKRKRGAADTKGDTSHKKRRIGNVEVHFKSPDVDNHLPASQRHGRSLLELPRTDTPQRTSFGRPRSLSIDSLPDTSRRRSRSLDSLSESVVSHPRGRSSSPVPIPTLSSRTHSQARRSRMTGVVISPGRPIPEPIYLPFRNEVAENQRLEVPGEDNIRSAGTLPERNLDSFTFYGHDGKYLPFALVFRCLETGSRRTILASGIVTRRLEDPGDGDSDLESVDTDLLVSLQPMVDFWVDYSPRQPGEVWIATKDAWYMLQEPEALYSTFYQPFWLAHHLAWQIARAVRQDKRITLSDFLDRIHLLEDDEAISIMGRGLLARDLEGDYTVLYILDQLSSPSLKKLLQTPLLCELDRRAELIDVTMEALFDLDTAEPPTPVHCSNQTVTMPLVHELTTGIFLTTLLKSGKELDDVERSHELLKPPELPDILHPDSPTVIEWEQSLRGHPDYFSCVCLDGEPYNVGDVIMVNPGEDGVTHRAQSAAETCSRSSNELSNKVWFCKIISLCKRDKIAHVQWYSHGARTILQETAHPYGLFALAECDDIPVGSVLGRCPVKHLKPGDREPNGYHCSFLWDADHCRFLDQAVLSAHDSIIDPSRPSCSCCAFNHRREEDVTQEINDVSNDHAIFRGTHYHKNDFVYIAASAHNPYLIGQVRGFKVGKSYTAGDTEVELTRLGRYDDVARATETSRGQTYIRDELRLFMTEQVECHSLELLEGKTFVYAKDKTKYLAVDQATESFYVDCWASTVAIRDSNELRPFKLNSLLVCEPCVKSAAEEQHRVQDYMKHRSPLRTMELFAGAGGLSTGLEQTGFVKTRWAVEMSSGAAATFQANHTAARVYNQDTNVCLQSAIDVREGKEYSPLYSLDDQKELPPMPQPGDVDLITGGFPCQSFSGMNHQRHKNPDDIRTTLVANMLSYVEFYEPRYVLMENVKGLLQHHIRGSTEQENENESDSDIDISEGVIKMGIVKFVLRALTRLGYQAQIKVLQAADYGSPQRRERVIIWGARRSHILPDYPFPTHVAPSHKTQVLNLPTKDKLKPAQRSDQGCAPHRALVISDAISDLPGFEWRNPEVLAKGKANRQNSSKWIELPAVSGVASPLTGFLEPVDYATSANTRYQKALRGNQSQVTLHCSRTFSATLVERLWHVCNNDARPDGYKDLPKSLWTPVMHNATPKKLKYVWQSRFGRLQWEAPFNTALTSCLPFTKGGKILHPTQKRIITARECARSQGFPDYYEFVQSEDNARHDTWARLMDDIHKQIGNAVPVPLARALGNALGKTLVAEWSRSQGPDASEEVCLFN